MSAPSGRVIASSELVDGLDPSARVVGCLRFSSPDRFQGSDYSFGIDRIDWQAAEGAAIS
jgi:hypothetical protein